MFCSNHLLYGFAKLGKGLEHSVQLFKEVEKCDSAVCNSMISSYTSHDISESANQLLVLMLREDIRPTEFTLSSILASICGMQVELGIQVHSLVVKTGFEIDFVVCSSLVHMYATLGLIDCAMIIFASMALPDLISWNTMIMGLTLNGRSVEAIDTFKELHTRGPLPDQISLTGVLRACSYGGFVDEGTFIFSKMEEYYGVRPCNEHYACLVDLLCQDGRLHDAIEITEMMPYEPNSTIWQSLLHACAIHGDVGLAAKVAVRLMESEPQLSLPYVVLGRIYEMRGQWEDAVRVRAAMKRNVVKNVGCSWIVIKNHVYSFSAEQLQQHAGRDIYSILRLLTWEKGETMPAEGN